MKITVLLFILFLSSPAFSQRTDSIPTLKEIGKAKGKIPLELYYPVDTALFKTVSIYLDSNFKKTGSIYYQGKYIFNRTAGPGLANRRVW